MAENPEPAKAEPDNADEQVPTFREAFAAAAAKSGFGQVTPGEAPSAGALLRAMGGIRGIVEAVLPPFAFLVVYTITSDLFWSVLPPLALAVVFVIVRIATKSPVLPAIGGLVLTAVSAGFALWTGKASDNFVLGFVINGVGLAFLLLSLIARRPLLGLIAGFLTGDEHWREDRAKFRVAIVATVLWIGLFGLRLGVELPLYFADAAQALAATKLILGLPLYAVTLWVTWLLMRTAYARPQQQ
jgi:uncharacterized protein DUF3159